VNYVVILGELRARLGENRSSMPAHPRPRRRAFVAPILVALAVAALPVAGARAQVVHEVEVGRLLTERDLTRESMRFYPGDLRVHQGDVVHFTSSGFHGVALLPAGVSAAEWTADFAGGIGRPWSLFEPDPDDGPDELKANLATVFPSRDCGWPTEAPCDFDGRAHESGDVLVSGLALVPAGDTAQVHQLDYSVTVNADPGEVVEVVDLVNPRMTMRIEVVDAGESASDPAAVAEQSDSSFQQDVATANRLHRSYSNKNVTKKVRGKTYRMAWAGVETPTVSLRGMYPRVIAIEKGQGVRWNFTEDVFSAYTVTFPASRALALARTFPVIACDPDGDAPSDSADTAPTSAQAPYCGSYAELELEVPAQLAAPAGDARLTSAKDAASSGLRGAGLVSDARPYDLSFPNPSPKKGFAYASALHEISGVRATGRIVVRRR
jgi:plastocyanin